MRYFKFILLINLFHTLAAAEDNGGNFYEKNFAKNPLSAVDKKKSVPIESSEPSANDKSVLKKDINPGKQFNEIDTSEETLNKNPGQEVKWLGLIISSQPEDHARTALKNLVKVATRHDFSIGVVILVGRQFEALRDNSLLGPIMARGAQLKFRASVPAPFVAENSPTWIIELDQGEVLLDGVLDPSLFFNQDGQYTGDPEAEAREVEPKKKRAQLDPPSEE